MHNDCIFSQGGFIRTESQADVVKGAKQDAPTSLSSRKLKRRRSILGYSHCTGSIYGYSELVSIVVVFC